MRTFSFGLLLAIIAFPAFSHADLVSLDTIHSSSLTARANTAGGGAAVSTTDSVTAIPFDNSTVGTTRASQGDWSASTSATLEVPAAPNTFTFVLDQANNNSDAPGNAQSNAIIFFIPNSNITYDLAANHHARGGPNAYHSTVTLKDETTSAILYQTTTDLSAPDVTATLPTSGGSLTGSLSPTDTYSITLNQILQGFDPSSTSTYTLNFAPVTTSSVPLPTSTASFLLLLPMIAIAKHRRRLASAL